MVGWAVAVVVVLASAVPASAHDELLSSTPGADERLPSAPDEITLTFSADVLDVGSEVVVADGDGTDWAATDPVVASGTVVVPLREGMPDAGYEVRWRVVSSDGHPISGLIPFTVGAGTPLERPSATPGDGSPSTGASSDAAPSDAVGASAPVEGIPRVVVVAAIGAGVALVAFLLFSFFRRAARGRASRKDLS